MKPSDSRLGARYSPGDCAHGVGHALMWLADYDVQPALDACKLFVEPPLAYYCATGAYMEYVTERDPGADTYTEADAYAQADRHAGGDAYAQADGDGGAHRSGDERAHAGQRRGAAAPLCGQQAGAEVLLLRQRSGLAQPQP